MSPDNEFRQNRLAWGLLLILSLVWGSSFILIKKGLIAFDAGQVGSLRIIAATVCYGLNVNLIKFKLAELDAITITSISLVMTGPVALIYLFTATDFTRIISDGNGVWLSFGAIVLLGVFGTAMALVLFNKLVRIMSPVFASSVTYLIPLVAVAWGIIDGEKIVTGQLLGMGLILAGVFIANRAR